MEFGGDFWARCSKGLLEADAREIDQVLKFMHGNSPCRAITLNQDIAALILIKTKA
jgi:hypothetical protein